MRIYPMALACALFGGAAIADDKTAPPDPVQATIQALEKQLQAQPDDPLVPFMLAIYYVRGQQGDKAVAMLERIAGNEVGLFPSPKDFEPIAQLPAYQAVLRKFEASQPPVTRGKVAVTVEGAPMVTEGIAFDPRDGAFYLSGADRNIVRVDRTGKRRDLTRPGQDGLAATLGMKIDPRRGVIWVASYRDDEIGGDGEPGLYAFGLSSGRTIEKHVPPAGKDAPATFNDLVVTRDGTVYATDSGSGALYRVKRGGKVEAFLPPGTFRGPNGIALSPDEKYAFVAQWRAPVRVELATGKTTPLAMPKDVVTAGIDGLYWWKHSLVAVQNVAHPGKLVRFALNDALDAVVAAEVLESRNPHFIVPTTAALHGDVAYVLANSQIGETRASKATVILAVPLS